MNKPARRRTLDQDICVHIFSASAAMVGVCIMVIGILRVVITIRRTDLIGDDLLALNALLYLVTCLLSYWALRTRNVQRNHALERISDTLFLLALTLTTLNAGFITWVMSVD